MRKLFVLVGVLVTALLAAPSTAMAGDTICTGLLTGAHDNVVVPAGSTCFIFSATIKGSVKVYGNLQVFAPTTIRGNIDGEPGHGFVQVFEGGVAVLGNVQLKGNTGPAPSGYLAGTQIGGNFQYEENRGFLVANGGVIGSRGSGNLKMEKNSGGGGIFGNTIRGNLECKENNPPPSGGGNTVTGEKKDQCSAF